MIPTEPTDPTPSDRVAPPGRAVRRGRFVPLAAAGTGVVLVAVSAVLLLHNRTLPADFGTVPGADGSSVAAAPAASTSDASTTATPTPPTSTPSTASPVPTTSGTTSTPAIRTTAGRPTATQTTTAARSTASTSTSTSTSTSRVTTRTTATRPRPVVDPRELPRQLVLPRFGVRADVLTVTSTDGTLAVPEDPQQVGWWAGSALPGSPSGTTVIDGHIDSATAGVGALIHLSDLVPGDHVSIVGSTGKTLNYDVVARRVYVKNAGLPPSLFVPGGPERLLLISCGGPFDSARGSYEDNIVVFATPSARIN